MSDSGAGGAEETKLVKVLEDLRSLSGEVDAGYVVSAEGRLLASTVKDTPEVDRDRLGAMLSALAGLSERRASERGHERAEQVRVRAPEGYVLLSPLSGGSVLAATTGPEARVGLVLYDMRNARAEAERALSEGS